MQRYFFGNSGRYQGLFHGKPPTLSSFRKSLHTVNSGAHILWQTVRRHGCGRAWEIGGRMREHGGMQSEIGDRLTAAKAWQRANRIIKAGLDESLAFSPTWGLLIDLYVAQFERQHLTAADLISSSNVSLATILRYFQMLERQGILEKRERSATDHATIIRLSSLGIDRLSIVDRRDDGQQ